MANRNQEKLEDLAASLVQAALRQGADTAEATAYAGWELTARIRLGSVELLEEAGHRSVALRVIRDQKVATTITSDLTSQGLERCVHDALELAQLTEPDPDSAPADASLLAHAPFSDLDLFDPRLAELDADQAMALAREAESSAIGFDSRVRLSEGATLSRGQAETALVLSSGFCGNKRGTHVSLSASPVVEDEGGKRRRGHYYSAARHFADLESPQRIGEEAARRTVRQLGSRRIPTCEASVVFSPDAARSLLATFSGCILGGALFRRSSYLLGKEGTQVASPLVTVRDNPSLLRGLGSRAFDGEGLPCQLNTVLEHGVFREGLLDCTSARKLGRSSTHSAIRHGGSLSSSVSNLVMETGSSTADELIKTTKRGLYLLEMMGFGFNPLTGDFSRGANGIWIENGELIHPVSEITISSNLDTMLKSIDAVADRAERKSSIIAPAFRVFSMTIAGE